MATETATEMTGEMTTEMTTGRAPAVAPHLVSCVGAGRDDALVGHFVAHYRGLGIPAERMHVVVHADEGDDAALDRTVERLAGLGVVPADVWRGTYTSGELWQRRRAVQRRLVRPSEWLVSADVDELHAYPAPLAEVVAHLEELGATVLQGPMLDRVAPGGVLAPVDPRRPLAEQFPVVADVMCPVAGRAGPGSGDGTVKMMLFRGDVLPGIGGHAPWVARHGPWRREGVRYAAGRPLAGFRDVTDARWRFAQPAAVHHYKWTAGLAEDTRRRREAPGASEAGTTYGDAVLDHLARHGGRLGLAELPVARPAPGLLRRSAHRVAPRRVRPLPPSRARTGTDWRDHLRALRERPVPEPPATPRRRPLSEEPPRVADGWRLTRLTEGTAEGVFHAHSYYDIPVLDDGGALIAAHRMTVEDRWMRPSDAVTVGIVDRKAGGFEPVATTTAWSWQQGPLAQWVPGTRRLAFNDREGETFVARVHDVDSGATETLPRPVYALSPDGTSALSLDMARLSRARPGYGYFGGDARGADDPAPADDGVWRLDLAGGAPRLVLPLADAVARLHALLPDAARDELRATPHLYWFNHAKFSPDGRRFTVKLRWRVASLEEPWHGLQSASLTVGTDGSDVRLLCRAASHVMWRDAGELVCWDEARERVSVLRDADPRGELLRDLPPSVMDRNVHLHPLRAHRDRYLYDVPYAETVQLRLFDEPSGEDRLLAELDRHVPAHGPFRCDLHPVPTADGETAVVTSLHDGGRQVYLLERDA